MATVDAMRIANKEMKKQYKGIDIDKIEVSRTRSTRQPLSLAANDLALTPLRAFTTTWRT